MKQGITSVENLVNEVNSFKDLKRDYIADVRNTEMEYQGVGNFKLNIEGNVEYDVNNNAMSQMAAWAHIPMSYVNYMQENGQGNLVADNFNSWFKSPVQDNTRRMYRGMKDTFAEKAGVWRSFHSNRFKRVDHEHILDAVMPEIENLADEYGDISIASLGLTDNKMYLKVLFPKTEAEAVGDIVQFGLTIGNSEIGKSQAFVSPLVYVLRCLNGMVLPDTGLKVRHVGSKIEEDGYVDYSNDTVESDQKTIMLKLRDTIRAVCNKENRNKILNKINESSSESTFVDNPMKAIEKTAKLYNFTQKETEDATLSFIKRGDYSKWGMVNAVTEVANTHNSYDRASNLESLGGRILTMGKSQWEEIALAA